MFTKDELKEILISRIESDEKLGYQAGSGDHIGHIDYDLDTFSEPIEVEKGWLVSYEYLTVVTTEFTIWPENPPMVYRHKKAIIIDEYGKIIEEISSETSIEESGNMFESIQENDIDY
ncbi:MAG: hypothetical protein HY738_23385 [Bacteroidia bacterium]|nr:hypothetical protein [Bacteroidia bacterium]